jgi:hypothetical protein
MKQVYSQISLDENAGMSHEYDLDEGYLFTTLKYSGSGNWGDQLVGTVAGSIQDTGDDLIIKVNGVKQLKLDYIQAQQFLILLLSNNTERLEIRESKTIKSI